MVTGLLVAAFVGGPAAAAVLAFAVAACRRDRRKDAEWADRMRAQPSNTVLSHVTADGEVIEYPIIRGESLVSLATTLGEIAARPEVAA